MFAKSSYLVCARFVVTLAIGLGLSASVPASDPGLRQLLTVGWEVRSDARVEAAKLYDQLLPQKDAIPLEHAFGLVLAKQNRYPDAIKHLQVAGGTLEISVLRLWVLILNRKSDEAISELRYGVSLLGDFRTTQPAAADLWVERMGRCHGFLEGPGATILSKNLLEADLPAIYASLSPEDKPAYDKGRGAVSREFARLKAEKSAVQTARDAAEKQKREEEKQKLNQQTERIAGRLDDIQNQASDVDDKLMAQRQQLDSQVPRVASNLNRAERNVDWLAWDAATISAELIRLDRLIEQETDPKKKAALISERNALAAFRISQGFALGDALDSRDIARSDAYLLQQRQAQVENRAARERAELDAQRSSLLQAQRRAEARLERLDRPIRQRSSRVATLGGAISSLKTYFQFPFDEERKRLLAGP